MYEPIRKNLMVAIPNTGAVRIEMLPFLLSNVNYIKELTIPSRRPIYYNRNKYITDFINSDCKWLLMIDSDTIPPLNSLESIEKILKEHPFIKILSGIYNTYNITLNKILPVLFKYEEKNYRNYSEEKIKEINTNELSEVDGCGGGFLLVHRSVIEAMKKPYFNNIYDSNIENLILSEDLYFCSQAQKLGFNIYTTSLIKCIHIKQINI
jgi:hypothetical protein